MKIELCRKHEAEYKTLITSLKPAADFQRTDDVRLEIGLPCGCAFVITGKKAELDMLQKHLKPEPKRHKVKFTGVS